ncbi:MAG: thermonuclease family protein [Chloroflexota bacterium]|nr:thermonuclease family protein [Chloroflexota bacterium]
MTVCRLSQYRITKRSLPMRHLVAAMILPLSLVLSVIPALTAPTSALAAEARIPVGATRATVLRVLDGDTIRVEQDGKRKTVRLLLVDAPETRVPKSLVECHGAEAKQRLETMLPKRRTVYLEGDTSKWDRRAQSVSYVWFKGKEDGKAHLANEILVQEGHGVLTTTPRDTKRVDRIQAAQEKAEAAQAGLWATCGGADTLLSSMTPAADASVDAPAAQPDIPVEASAAQAGVPVEAPAATTGVVPPSAGAFTPVSVAIPAIGVNAGIEYLGISGGVMGNPQDPYAVGWYPDFGAPGGGGSVVMAGHVDYWTVGPAVFASLGALGGGEQIVVVGPDGTGATYVVTGVWSVSASTPAEAVIGGGGTLTLITCTGSFNGVEYDSRLVVQAVLV